MLRCDGACMQAFDQLLLLKRGGQTIYCGPLGTHSSTLITYFQVRPRPCNCFKPFSHSSSGDKPLRERWNWSIHQHLRQAMVPE